MTDSKLTFECPICLDSISPTDNSYTLTSPCDHFYHEDCILSWTKLSASTCPQCRKELTSIRVINKSKTVLIEQKDADKLHHMIEQPSQNNQDTHLVSTEGLANVLITTSSANHANRSLYHRMLNATSGSNSVSMFPGSLFSRNLNILGAQGESSTLGSSNPHNHLTDQKCFICDNNVLRNQIIICPQCSALFHRSCSDGLNCPLCEEWIDDIPPPESAEPFKRRRNRNNILASSSLQRSSRNDDSGYYVELVNEIQRRSESNQKQECTTNNEAANIQEEAWSALDQIQDLRKADVDKSQINDIPKNVPGIVSQERKLKRPSRSKSNTNTHISSAHPTSTSPPFPESRPAIPTRLTESALASLDSKFKHHKNSKRIRTNNLLIPPTSNSGLFSGTKNKWKKLEISKSNKRSNTDLSFTQKLVVQRLLLKPRLNRDLSSKLSFDSYTQLNKQISHKLYTFVQNIPTGISSMNAVIELAEREGFLPFENRKDVDLFGTACKDNTILLKFINGNWSNNIRDSESLISSQLDELINTEVTTWLQVYNS